MKRIVTGCAVIGLGPAEKNPAKLAVERTNAALVGRPDHMGRTSLTAYQGMVGMSENGTLAKVTVEIQPMRAADKGAEGEGAGAAEFRTQVAE